MNKHLIIGTAGHVDHGKTALVKALTQIDCDTHPEEKQRGITIHLGFAHIRLPDGNAFGIVDVPGHKDFIQTMVAGTSGIDLILLVIAADSGIMPQTREHLSIIQALGVTRGIVVISKSDLADQEWLDMLELEIRSFLEGSFLNEAPIVRVSAQTGHGISDLVDLLQAEALVCKSKPSEGAFRLYIDRLFSVKGQGYVATGSVLSGHIQSKDKVYLLPSGKEYTVKGIQRFGQEVADAFAGDRAAINLAGFKPEDFERGMLLSSSIRSTSERADASIQLFPGSTIAKKHSYVLFLCGTFQTKARMHLIDAPKLEEGEEAIVQFHFDKKPILERGDRFILRNTSNDSSLGGGYIIDSQPLHHKRPKADLIESLQGLKQAIESQANELNLLALSLLKLDCPVKVDQLRDEASIQSNPSEFSQEELLAEGIHYFPDLDMLVHRVYLEKLEQKVLAILAEHHQKFYLLASGLTASALSGKLGIRAKTPADQLFPHLLKLIPSIREHQGQWMLANFTVKLSAKDREDLEWMDEQYAHYAWNKPVEEDLDQAATQRNIAKEKRKMYCQYLVNEGRLYAYDQGFLHASVVKQAKERVVEELIRRGKGMNEGDFRTLLGATRKIVPPLLSILQKEVVINQEKFIISLPDSKK